MAEPHTKQKEHNMSRALRWTIALMLSTTFLIWPARIARAQDDANNHDGKPVVAVFNFHGELTEKSAGEDLPIFGPPPQSLRETVEHMRKAATDANVKAVVLMSEGPMFGVGQ